MGSIALVTALALQLCAASAMAGPGDFDTGFGVDGTQAVAARGLSSTIATAAPDGGVLVAGQSANHRVFVARLNPDGTPDTGFGEGGRKELSIPGESMPSAIAVMRDGRIVVVGQTLVPSKSADALVMIVGPDGDSIRHHLADNGGTEGASAVALQDGKVLAAGFTSAGRVQSDAAVWRFDPETGLDTGFGMGGSAFLDCGGSDRANAIAVRPDGRIVVAGLTLAGTGSTQDAVVWRLLPDGGAKEVNGALDDGFDGDGVAGLHQDGHEVAQALWPLSDGSVLVAGHTNHRVDGQERSDGMVWRVKPDGGPGEVNGALDHGFGFLGRVRVGEADAHDQVFAMARQPDGAIVVAGASGMRAAVWRLRPDGAGVDGGAGGLDVSFAETGVRRLAGWQAMSVTVLPDRRILIAGYHALEAGFVSRLLGDPFTLSVTRSGGGAVVSDPGGIHCGSVCSGRFDFGARVGLTAVPAEGSRFIGWTGGGCSGSATCSVTVDGDIGLEARFEPAPDRGDGKAGPASFGVRTDITLKSGRLDRRRRVKILIRNANAFAVTGTLAATKPRGLRRRSLKVPARGSVRVTLSVPRSVARRMRRGGRLRLVLRATVRDPAGNTRMVVLRTRA